jgi:hypothetical protein
MVKFFKGLDGAVFNCRGHEKLRKGLAASLAPDWHFFVQYEKQPWPGGKNILCLPKGVCDLVDMIGNKPQKKGKGGRIMEMPKINPAVMEIPKAQSAETVSREGPSQAESMKNIRKARLQRQVLQDPYCHLQARGHGNHVGLQCQGRHRSGRFRGQP